MIVTALWFVAAGQLPGRERKTATIEIQLEEIFIFMTSVE